MANYGLLTKMMNKNYKTKQHWRRTCSLQHHTPKWLVTSRLVIDT